MVAISPSSRTWRSRPSYRIRLYSWTHSISSVVTRTVMQGPSSRCSNTPNRTSQMFYFSMAHCLSSSSWTTTIIGSRWANPTWIILVLRSHCYHRPRSGSTSRRTSQTWISSISPGTSSNPVFPTNSSTTSWGASGRVRAHSGRPVGLIGRLPPTPYSTIS
jgi:hypothetical protein